MGVGASCACPGASCGSGSKIGFCKCCRKAPQPPPDAPAAPSPAAAAAAASFLSSLACWRAARGLRSARLAHLPTRRQPRRPHAHAPPALLSSADAELLLHGTGWPRAAGGRSATSPGLGSVRSGAATALIALRTSPLRLGEWDTAAQRVSLSASASGDRAALQRHSSRQALPKRHQLAPPSVCRAQEPPTADKSPSWQPGCKLHVPQGRHFPGRSATSSRRGRAPADRRDAGVAGAGYSFAGQGCRRRSSAGAVCVGDGTLHTDDREQGLQDKAEYCHGYYRKVSVQRRAGSRVPKDWSPQARPVHTKGLASWKSEATGHTPILIDTSTTNHL